MAAGGAMARSCRVTMPEMDPIDFTCPRCGSDASADYYGPCSSCREQLQAAASGEKRSVEAPEYEPKVNVTANAVALKDD